MILKTLKKIGLTDNEIKVYISLLELGFTKTGQLIKNTKLHSSRVYGCLERLESKGLISYVLKSNIKYFKANNPERLIDYLDEKEKRIEEDKLKIKKIIPQLKAKKSYNKPIQEASIYSGIKGIKSLLNNLLDDLKSRKEYYDFGADGSMKEILGPFFKLFQKQK